MSKQQLKRHNAKPEEAVSNYLREQGRKGGKKSKRKLTPEQARAMVKAREAKKEVR